MNNYELFDVDDFVSDTYFIEWVLDPQPSHHAFWEKWQQQNPQQIAKINAAKRILNSLSVRPLAEELSPEETEEILANVQRNIAIKTTKPFYLWTNVRLWTAAAIVIISACCFWLYDRNGKDNAVMKPQDIAANGLNEYDNNTNTSKIIRFTDGSLAILKPKSKLKYPTTFTGATRTVYLEGEAFFEVQKDPQKPFLVYSQDMVTQVLGTSFTVKAFGSDEEFKVVVNTGKVKVYHKNQLNKENAKVITLVPHQQATYKRELSIIKKDTVQTRLLLTEEEASESFTLNKVTLSEVIVKLEEAYGVHINYNKAELGQLKLTAQLANLPLDQKVELVCKAINATFKFSNGEIFISSPLPN